MKIRRSWNILFAITLILPIAQKVFAADELLKYLDENGRSFYVDSVEKIPPQFRNSAKESDKSKIISRVTPGRVQLYQKKYTNSSSSSTRSNAKIEIFVAKWCGFCRTLERDLTAAKIPFKKYDIDLDPIGKKTYQELGGGGIPIIRIDKKKILRGYSSLEDFKSNL